MPSTDWGRVDNQAYMPANVAKANLVAYTEGIVKGLEGTNEVPQAGGKKKTPTLKSTGKKVKIGSVERVIYEGTRGGKYVKLNGSLVTLDKAKKSHSK